MAFWGFLIYDSAMKNSAFLLLFLLLTGCASGGPSKSTSILAAGLVFEHRFVEDRWCFRLGGNVGAWRRADLPDHLVSILWVCDKTPPKDWEEWSIKTEKVTVVGEVDLQRAIPTVMITDPDNTYLMPVVWDGEVERDRRWSW